MFLNGKTAMGEAFSDNGADGVPPLPDAEACKKHKQNCSYGGR